MRFGPVSAKIRIWGLSVFRTFRVLSAFWRRLRPGNGIPARFVGNIDLKNGRAGL